MKQSELIEANQNDLYQCGYVSFTVESWDDVVNIMQPNRQYNQTQTYGVYFPQSSAQGYQHQAVAAPAYQSYGSGPAQFVQGQPVFSVKPLYPPPIPYQPNTAQNYRGLSGQAFIGPPPGKPFPEQHLQPPPQFNQIGPRPPTPPQAPALFTPPGNQGPPNQYNSVNWSTNVTPPSPYYNSDRASPVQPCSVPLPPRLRMLGQYVQQSQSAVPELNNSFNGNQIAANDVSKFSPDPITSGKVASPGKDNKNVFKQKAFQHGISLESPPKLNELESVNYSNGCSYSKNKNPKTIGKTDAAMSANIINSSKTGKRPRDEDADTKTPLTLPAKTVAERNLGKQKLRDDWWSVSDTSNLSGNNSVSRDDSIAFSVALNDNKELAELSAYSSFPDSSVDISKVLADSSINTSVDSKAGEVFDDSVDYIEEHEFLSYDVTSSPFPLYDSENDDTDTEFVDHEEMPENPLPESQSVSNYIEKELKVISMNGTKDENYNLKSDNEKTLQTFQMKLKQSENKKAELLNSGIKSDENIEMLASAIVNVVLAKAVIDVISCKEIDKKDVVENENKDVAENENIMFQDTEISEELNQNTNAETNQIVSKAEEKHENLDTDHKPNYRQRLYSWPYTTDSDVKVKYSNENNVEKQTLIDGPQSVAKDIVEIIVEPGKAPEKKELETATVVKTAKESAEDFEKYYFKQKASQHGIDIVSPRCQLKRASSLSSESENESEKAIQKTGIPKQNFIRSSKKELNISFDQQSRSQSESSDIHSLDESDSQVDPSYIFRQNASRCGIKIQNPKETIELSAENSDAELESYSFQNKILQLDDPKRCDTSTPEPDKLSLNPESPEFKPGWKKTLENSHRTSSLNGMRADAPAFNPGSLNTSSSDLYDSMSKIEMRVDAPEFNPSKVSVRANASSFEPQTKTKETDARTAKVFHIPTPKMKQEKPAVGIQASPQTCDSSANTRRVKTKESGMETASCNSREVSVNTDFPGNLDKDSHTLPIKSKSFASKNTNTDVPKRRSIAVSVNFSGGYQDSKSDDRQKLENAIVLEREQAEMMEQMKNLQVEVMKHRANLHVTRIFLMEQKIQKEASLLIDSLKFSQDKSASDAIWSVVDAKLNTLEATVRKINSVADDTVAKIHAGYVFKTLPDFTFFSEDVEQNRVIANKQLYEIASGNPPQDTQSQIKIDFLPTNRNVIEFTAKSKSPGGRTPEKIDFSPTNRKQIMAESKSPGGRTPEKIDFSPTNRNLIEFTAKPKSSGCRTPEKVNRSPARKYSPLAPVLTVRGSDELVSETQSPLKEQEISRRGDVINPTEMKAEKELVDRPKAGGSLMDLDLDSDDEITEVSTALVDYDEDLSLIYQPDVGGPEPEYAGSKDLKNLISSKMNEVYGEFSETTDVDSGANEELTTSMNDIEKDIKNTDRIQTSVSDSGMKNENPIEIDHSVEPSQTHETMENVVVAKQISEYDNIKLTQESLQELDTLKQETETQLSGDVNDEMEKTDEKVPDNWEKLEMDLTEVYKSPEVHPNLENVDENDVNAPQNLPAQEGADSVALISDEQTVEGVRGKDKAVAYDHIDSIGSSSVVTSIPSSNELRVKPEMQVSESVTLSLNSIMTSASTVVTSSSASLVSSVANAVPPLMSLMQSSGNNVMAQPMLMNNLNPMLYQLVVAQLVKAYPALAANPDMLSTVSLQQASLLQHYMVTGQISSANIAEALQGSMSDNTDPGAIGIGAQIPDSNVNTQISSASANERNASSGNVADSVKSTIDPETNVCCSNVGTAKDTGRKDETSEVVNETSVPTKTKPPPYRPPGLRGDIVTSPSNSMFQNARTNKHETEASAASQNPFSAVRSQSIRAKTLESMHTSANVSSLSRPNSNNSASKLSDLSKPLRRPFKQYMPTSKSVDSITPSSNVVYDSIPNSASASGLSDFSEPLRRPFKQSLSESKPTSNMPVVSSNVPSRVQTGVNSSQSFNDNKIGVPQGRSHDSSNKPPDFLPQYAKRHSPELRDKKEVPSSDFLPSFVKQVSDDAKNHSNNVNKPATQSFATPTENQQNFQRQLPPRFRNMSAPQRQSSYEEDWDEEIEEFSETKTMKVNPKRELHLRSSSSRKPVPTDALLTSMTSSKIKNDSADLTNPLFQRSTSFPSEFKEGTSGLSDIPLPKKLRTSEEETKKGGEGEKEEEEWCEVTTKKKKQKELKRFSAPYVNSAPVQSQAEKQQKQSNFERLIEKIQEKCPTATRSEAIDSVTKLREQRGGNLKNIGLHEIVNQATTIIQQQARPAKGSNPHIPGLWPSQRSSTPPKLMSLPIVQPSMNSSMMPRDDEEICVICHDPLSYEETKSLDCKHVFHSNCINQWVYGRERTCPTCRQHALFPEEFPRLGK